MFTVPEQFTSATNATKAAIDAQLATITALTEKAYANVEKVIQLNISVAKESVGETTVAAKALIGAKGPQEFISLTTASTKPNTEKAIAYVRQLAAITVAAQTEITRDAEVQLAETRRKVAALIDNVSKNAPRGTESVVALVKTAMGNANAGFDQFSKTAKQAAETVEVKIAESLSNFSQASAKATSRATRK
ncbi:MAG: phasin family protein [Burkholderiaceae bacterium]